MATSVGTARPVVQDSDDALRRVIAWIKAHRQLSLWVAVIVVVGGGLLWWNALSTRQSEQNAGRALASARLAFESRNFPLASSELSRIIANYSGTHAAQEANLLLAQVRLAQGQSQSAIELLRRFAPAASREFRAQAYGLLGGAYENVAHPKEAAEAYQQAAETAPMPFLRAQFLSDAGRAWTTAGDTGKAVAAYQEIVTKLDSTNTVMEAKVRLGELTRGVLPK
jgi:tetratricopeptide (TPR) repeat protein